MVTDKTDEITWQNIWEHRAQEYGGESAAVIDGFDSGRGKMTKQGLQEVIEVFVKGLELKPSDKILEIGCGAGMILEKLPVAEKGKNIFGIDYSFSMALRSKEAGLGAFAQSEAAKLPFQDNSFDKAYSYSVFQYFPDLSYAEAVLLEIKRILKPGGRVVIGDIPDAAHEAEILGLAQANPHNKSDFKDNDNLKHVYYPETFFEKFAEQQNWDVRFLHPAISDYANSQFRYFVIFQGSPQKAAGSQPSKD